MLWKLNSKKTIKPITSKIINEEPKKEGGYMDSLRHIVKKVMENPKWILNEKELIIYDKLIEDYNDLIKSRDPKMLADLKNRFTIFHKKYNDVLNSSGIWSDQMRHMRVRYCVCELRDNVDWFPKSFRAPIERK
jgi:hypothetical protein